MTNREVLAKFLKQAFNFEIQDSFNIGCHNIYCSSFTDCTKCPGKKDFWDEEFTGDENIQLNNNSNERVAVKEISW